MTLSKGYRGKSLIDPPGDFIPEGVTSDEARWLRKMLELDFEGRDVVLKQISSAHVKRDADADSVELFFEDVDDAGDINTSCSSIVALDANRGKSPYVPSNLIVFKSRIDFLYVYMPDRSELILSEIPLDDVEYEIAPYEMRARREIYELFDESGATRLNEFGSFLLARVEGNKKMAQSMLMDIAKSLGGEVGAGLGPFSLSLRVDLGSDGTDSYVAIAQCSLVGNYFLSYIEKNGRESQYPPSGGFPLRSGPIPMGNGWGD